MAHTSNSYITPGNKSAYTLDFSLTNSAGDQAECELLFLTLNPSWWELGSVSQVSVTPVCVWEACRLVTGSGAENTHIKNKQSVTEWIGQSLELPLSLGWDKLENKQVISDRMNRSISRVAT